MTENQIIVTTPEAIKDIIIKALQEHDKSRASKKSETKLFTINKVAKILGVSHSTVKKLVENETLKTTIDNKITEKELNRYLSQ
ncbi:MAG: helix-turn-helix domain-containing protein [Chlorobi bacterium]|nr:helix-turn-helix domain-containing protein [Chlorobiota bacterium]